MVLQRSEFGRTVLAPAKLNLYLEVLGRREDGFHEVETLVVPVRIFDELHLTPLPSLPNSTERFQLDLVGPCSERETVPSDDSNLALRAVRLLAERAGCEQGAAITLRKRIPTMAGLGGGSSDAAAALMAANSAWRLGWSRQRLSGVAAEIGSDVPFFLAGGAAICRGRGERVEPIELPASMPCVIVQPPAGLATSQVYERFIQLEAPTPISTANRLSRLLADVRSGNWRGWSLGLHNSLQSAAARISPWVDRLAAAFARLPFLAHQLTGSGAAYFGLCRHNRQARALAGQLVSQHLGRVFVTRTCREFRV